MMMRTFAVLVGMMLVACGGDNEAVGDPGGLVPTKAGVVLVNATGRMRTYRVRYIGFAKDLPPAQGQPYNPSTEEIEGVALDGADVAAGSETPPVLTDIYDGGIVRFRISSTDTETGKDTRLFNLAMPGRSPPMVCRIVFADTGTPTHTCD